MGHELASSRPAEVLLVEDNEQDVVLTREGFRRAKFLVNLHHVENGEECLAFLRKEGRFSESPTPDLILLDINLPVMDGREVLAEIVVDEQLKSIPVVVLTTSSAETDILEMYKLRCSSYITKPVDFEQFQKLVNELGNYWFTLVVMPPKAG
jgi:two-component system, chemotaxis family, response regulator Rcp1